MIQLKSDIACECSTMSCDIYHPRHFRHKKAATGVYVLLCASETRHSPYYSNKQDPETHIEIICTGVKLKIPGSYYLTGVFYFPRLKYCPQLEKSFVVVTISDRGPQTQHPSICIYAFYRFHSFKIFSHRILEYHVQIKCHLNHFSYLSPASRRVCNS